MNDTILFTILGFVQGLTEFLPVSSTGHLVLAREWLGVTSSYGLAEDAVLHLATALAVLVYFRNDIKALIIGSFQALQKREKNKDSTVAVALIIGPIPAVVFGLLFESALETTFRGPSVVALALIVGSFIFLGAEWLGRRTEKKEDITVGKGFLIGLFQVLALVPGMSRSGMVISGGLLLGLSRFEAARFGFLLSFPVILGAGVLKLYELLQTGALSIEGGGLVWGALAAFVSGMVAIHVLLQFVRTHSLMPFVIYRFILAGVILLFLV